MQEVETKLSVHPSFVLPDLSDAVPGGHAAGKPDRDIRSTYWDTTDLRLARAGVTLRHRRTDGEDEGWQWKVPSPASGPGRQRAGATDDGALARTEITVPGAPSRPPSAVRDRLAVLTRTAPLTPVARLRTLRRVIEVHRDGEVVAEVTDDEVTVVDAGRIAARFREVEVELVGDGDAAVMRSVVGTLVASGATQDAQRPKLFVALGPRAAGPGDLTPSVTDPERRPFARVLAERLDRLCTVDPWARRCAGRVADDGPPESPAERAPEGFPDRPADSPADAPAEGSPDTDAGGDHSPTDDGDPDGCTGGDPALALAGVLTEIVALLEVVDGRAPEGLVAARDAAAEVAATGTALAVLRRDPGPVGASAAALAAELTDRLGDRWSRLSRELGDRYLAALEDVVTLLHERPDHRGSADADQTGRAPVRLDDVREAALADPGTDLPRLAAAVALLDADGAGTGKLVRRAERAVGAAQTLARNQRARAVVAACSAGSGAFAAGYVAARLGDRVIRAEQELAEAVTALDGKRLRRLAPEQLPGP